MRQYLARRLLLFVPTLFIVSLIIFGLLRLGPGDPIEQYYGDASSGTETNLSAKEIQELREYLNLDDHIVVQYFKWLGEVVTLSPGQSFRPPNLEVLDEVVDALPLTAEIALATIVLSLLIAIPLGVISAVRQDTLIDYGLRVFSIGFLAMPIFWTAILALLIGIETANWIPPLEYKEIWEDPLQNVKKLWLPILILAINSGAVIARMMRSATLEVLRQDYVRTAHAKGLKETLVISRHVIKNAMLPVVTVAGLQAAILFSGTLIMESLFVLPGLGLTLLYSINDNDFPMVQFIVVMVSLFIMILNLVIDVIYGWLDPRIRLN